MEKKQVIFYGWVIVAVSFVAQIIAYAVRYNFSLFYVAILQDFNWTREATALAFSINLIVYALSAPLAGTLVDRFGIRRLVSIGAVILGLTLIVCSRIQTIWELYLRFSLIRPWCGCRWICAAHDYCYQLVLTKEGLGHGCCECGSSM